MRIDLDAYVFRFHLLLAMWIVITILMVIADFPLMAVLLSFVLVIRTAWDLHGAVNYCNRIKKESKAKDA